MFQTKITSQGTISIPISLRRKYNLKAGEVVTISDVGHISISKNSDFASLRAKNAAYLSKKPPVVKNEQVWETYVNEKYGQK